VVGGRDGRRHLKVHSIFRAEIKKTRPRGIIHTGRNRRVVEKKEFKLGERLWCLTLGRTETSNTCQSRGKAAAVLRNGRTALFGLTTRLFNPGKRKYAWRKNIPPAIRQGCNLRSKGGKGSLRGKLFFSEKTGIMSRFTGGAGCSRARERKVACLTDRDFAEILLTLKGD